MNLKSIFIFLPHQIKSFLFNFISYFTYLKRYSGKFNDYLAFFLTNNDVSFLNENSTVNITEEVKILYDINHSKPIKDFDIIDKVRLKEMIKKNNYYELISYKQSLNTSGTSGSALLIPVSNDFLKYKFASSFFFKEIHNSGIKIKSASFIGQVIFPLNQKKPPFWIESKYTNQLIFSQYHLNQENVIYYVQALIENNIKTIHGYPSTISILSQLILDLGIQNTINDLSLVSITLGSESLSIRQRSLIEGVFKCKVYNFYGQTESVADIFECEKGKLHINESFSFVELIDNKNGYFNLVGTQLKNTKFPLIRYDTGDLVVYNPEEKCKCGRKSRIISEIIGRNEDFLILNDGRRIGRLDHIFKDSFAVVESQFIQHEKGKSKLLIVKSKEYKQSDEDNIKDNINEKLGFDFNVEIKYVDTIQKSKNGKLKQVVNKITLLD